MPTIEYRLKPQGETLEAFMLDRKRCSFIMGPLCCQKIFKLMCEQNPAAEGCGKSGEKLEEWRNMFARCLVSRTQQVLKKED